MALFEFEGGHLVPAQFGRPVANGLTPEVLDSVRGQVLEIVSRPLFPITWRDMSRVSDPSNDTPRLTALDASGQVVSVEVLEHLDSDTLIASLSRLADTASLSWSDLAREYPGDIEGFKAGWVHFRDSMPPSPAPGPRLVMVVGSIDAQVRPALDVLASSGVEVHEMSLRQMSNGRAFMEVHAVGPRLYGHNPQVLLGRTGAIPELSVPRPATTGELPAAVEHPRDVGEQAGAEHVAQDASNPATGGEDLPGIARTEEHPGFGPGHLGSVGTAQHPRARHAGFHAQADTGSATSGHATTIPHLPAHEGAWSEALGAWEGAGEVQRAPEAAEPASEASTSGETGAPTPQRRTHGEDGTPEPRIPAADTPVTDMPATDFSAPDTPVEEAHRAHAAAAWSSADRRSSQRPEALEGVPVLERDTQAMEALGRIVGEEAPLVLRPSLTPPVAGVLTPRGQIRVPSGSYPDPTEALAASGHPGLDGWEEWHLGDGLGPTLAESLDEVNAEIVREYERAAERPRHS